MDRIKKILPIFLFAGILIGLLLPFYKNGKMISGGEGAYFLDYLLLLRNRGFSWMEYGVGIVSYSISFAFIFHLIILQLLTHSERLVNFVMIFLLYFLPFVAVYGVARLVKLQIWLAFLIGLFYIVNPFTSNFLKSINQWNMLAAFMLPAFFWLILRFYQNNITLFLSFGVFSTYFSFTNSNPPTMVLYQIAFIIFIVFAHLYKEKKFNPIKIFQKYLVIFSSFLFFNFWWIINWFYVFTNAQALYTTGEALTWLKGSGDYIPVMWRSLSLSSLTSGIYTSSMGPIFLVIPLLISVIAFFQKKKLKNYHLLLLGIIFVVIFLTKGTSAPLGKLYELMVVYLPLFNIFKSASEKWGILLIFLITIFIIFFLKLQKKRSFNVMAALLTVYVFYNSIPFISGKFLPDYKHDDIVTGSRIFIDKAEYQRVRQELNNDPLQYRILSLPGGYNYQVALRIEGNRYYTGNDPILNNINKQFIAPYVAPLANHIQFFFDNISDPNYLKALPYFNIKKIIINHDEYPWYKFRAKESTDQIEKILSGKLKSVKDGGITLFDTGDNYLPRFYVPTEVVKTDKPYDKLMDVFQEGKHDPRAVFITSTKADHSTGQTPPNITIAKINPSKYRIKVENVKSPYLLVFSTNFHPGWRTYIKPESKNQTDYSKVVAEYFDSQIKESAVNFTFIKKDALETLGIRPLPEDRHFMVNWYANAWYIKPEDAGNKENYEIIVEYWPQRLFYLGATISLSTLLGSSIILALKIKKRK